jgi:aspartate/methionine/tyrosine aminotransferase
MDFSRTDYLSWYIPRLNEDREVIHLDASGVPSLRLDEITIPATDPWTMIPLLEQALAEWQGAEAAETVFTPGATGGTLLALLTLADRDSEIVVESPIYEPMLRQAQRVATVRRLVRRQDQGYRLSLDTAGRVISGATSLVMITEPHNPSGRLSPRDDILELAAIAESNGARLLINEVYRGFTDQPSYHGAAENIIVVSSLSKLLGAYWARVGWLAAPAPEASRLRMAQLNMSMGSSLGAGCGLGILETAKQRRQEARGAALTGRRNDLV